MKKITLAVTMLALSLVPTALHADGFTTKSLNDDGTTTFDFNNTKNYVLIYCGDEEKEAMGTKVKADYRVNDTNNFLYIWESTYTAKDASGMINSFGAPEGYIDFLVSDKKWSGFGFASAEVGKNLSMLDDSYYLHFAMKGTDSKAHASHAIIIGDEANKTQAKFTIGATGFVDNGTTYKVLADFNRDGEWYSFDIPLSTLKIMGCDFSKATNYMGNVFSALSGGTTGTEFICDGIFFYQKNTTGIDNVNSEESQSKSIYDISGRQVKSMKTPGMYVIKSAQGTKKVLVK
jgi:hypothetical protein